MAIDNPSVHSTDPHPPASLPFRDGLCILKACFSPVLSFSPRPGNSTGSGGGLWPPSPGRSPPALKTSERGTPPGWSWVLWATPPSVTPSTSPPAHLPSGFQRCGLPDTNGSGSALPVRVSGNFPKGTSARLPCLLHAPEVSGSSGSWRMKRHTGKRSSTSRNTCARATSIRLTIPSPLCGTWRVRPGECFCTS